ncbi:MAG: indole-3-glycerol phosphate synthase TrpC [Bacteroidetes bacterium]|nr:indole-3-glycerol phosphate synthase TrpC [Bacteroidota bacterium]
MNILEKIVLKKKTEITDRKASAPINVLEKSSLFKRKTVSLKHALQNGRHGIIAEFKRKSPSKGIINSMASVRNVTNGYVQAGASALSVLTDEEFFGGSNQDLVTARKSNSCPILRKDFIIDEYQIVEAKAIGADVILLIAAILTPQQVKSFSILAGSLGLEVLLEIHDEEELKANYDSNIGLIGVNNRNLKTFEVDVENSKKLSELIPKGAARISESGINSPNTIIELRKFGFKGFLMGENFMKHPNPVVAANDFFTKLSELS